MQGDKCAALVLRWQFVAAIKADAQGCVVGAKVVYRRNTGLVLCIGVVAEIRVAYRSLLGAAAIDVGPAIKSTLFNAVEFVWGEVIAEPVAAIVGGIKLLVVGVPVKPGAVADTGGDDFRFSFGSFGKLRQRCPRD